MTISQGQLIKKNPQKMVNIMLKIFLFCFKHISKCGTCFYIHFSRAFQKLGFQICSFSHKKVMGYLDFFFHGPYDNILCKVQYPLYSRVFSVQQSNLCTVQYPLYKSVPCVKYSILCTVEYSLYCTVFSVQYSILCTNQYPL